MQSKARIHALAEPLAVAALIGAAAGDLIPRGPLALILVAALAVLAGVAVAKTIVARRTARWSRRAADTAYSITDVFDQVTAIWDARGAVPDEVWNTDIEDWEREPIPGYIGRHRAPELVAA